MVTSIDLNSREILPDDAARATLIGRVFVPEFAGPSVVVLRGDNLVDITGDYATISDLLEQPDPLAAVRAAKGAAAWPLSEVIRNSLSERNEGVYLLSPIDLSAVKAAGVTFVTSLVERLIEERAGGDSNRANEIRLEIETLLGSDVGSIIPASPEAFALKNDLSSRGLWSQYLEVGLGADPEVFTKAQILSTVGVGSSVGISNISTWNNPEPEVVLVMDSAGHIQGATLGNDVNLRDVEGRSALLLPKAKDNNASASLGPFIRLFDEDFTLDDVRVAVVRLEVDGEDDGFRLDEVSIMSEISRDVQELADYTLSDSHQYPDGLVLYTGTLFAPRQDRGEKGMGFTHHLGDVVCISSPRLGSLVNRVAYSEEAPPWTFGVRSLIQNLKDRGLLSSVNAAGAKR